MPGSCLGCGTAHVDFKVLTANTPFLFPLDGVTGTVVSVAHLAGMGVGVVDCSGPTTPSISSSLTLATSSAQIRFASSLPHASLLPTLLSSWPPSVRTPSLESLAEFGVKADNTCCGLLAAAERERTRAPLMACLLKEYRLAMRIEMSDWSSMSLKAV